MKAKSDHKSQTSAEYSAATW